MDTFDERIVANPRIFEQNSIAPHSDHEFFPDEEDYESGKNSFRFDLNGLWKFSYAPNPKAANQEFFKEDYDCHFWDEIRVPAHIQMEGYDVPQYANTQYPWDGIDVIEPGEIPTRFIRKVFLCTEGDEGKENLYFFPGCRKCYGTLG